MSAMVYQSEELLSLEELSELPQLELESLDELLLPHELELLLGVSHELDLLGELLNQLDELLELLSSQLESRLGAVGTSRMISRSTIRVVS
jgi:hypothetical protein